MDPMECDVRTNRVSERGLGLTLNHQVEGSIRPGSPRAHARKKGHRGGPDGLLIRAIKEHPASRADLAPRPP